MLSTHKHRDKRPEPKLTDALTIPLGAEALVAVFIFFAFIGIWSNWP